MQQLNILTEVHNFDIRRIDNKTPAQHLFQKEFPDIFEFALNDVTSFAQPRQRRYKPLKSLSVSELRKMSGELNITIISFIWYWYFFVYKYIQLNVSSN